MQTTRRPVNPRGHGVQLRGEILAAAARLLAGATSRDAMTLRAIAREAGIAAPSIYPHFADRDAILDAVVAQTFEHLAQVCATAAAGHETGADQVRAICAAYLSFAREHPGQYRVLFERAEGDIVGRPYAAGLDAFHLLVRALQRSASDGTSGSTVPARDAQVLWAALHGVTTLVPATPGFPWLSAEELVARLVATILGRSVPGAG